MKPIQFKGTGTEYFKIWIVNVLLCMLTLGIYYPWAKVRTRRYFNANTEYAGRYFDYHATGQQLFLGYLIGVIILIAINIISSISPVIAVIMPVLLLAIIPWIIWRSLKFNMRMLSFSNVRFSFIGHLKSAYGIYMLLPVLGYAAIALLIFIGLTPLTRLNDDANPAIALTILGGSILAAIALGVYITGLFTKKAAEYQISQTKFGQGNFLTHLSTDKFIKITLKTTLIMIGGTLLLTALAGGFLASTAGGLNLEYLPTQMESASSNPMVIIGFIAIYLSFIAVFLFATTYSYSRQRQYLFENTTLDNDITFKSTVSAKGYFIVLITNMLLTLLTLGLAMPWAKVRVARYLAKNSWIDAKEVDINTYLTQKEEEQSAIGEEIGDVLDVDVAIAI